MTDWNPSPAQIELFIDCSRARLSVERTAALLGVSPRQIWLLAMRLDRPIIDPSPLVSRPRRPRPIEPYEIKPQPLRPIRSWTADEKSSWIQPE
jgi:hypothetical protein